MGVSVPSRIHTLARRTRGALLHPSSTCTYNKLPSALVAPNDQAKGRWNTVNSSRVQSLAHSLAHVSIRSSDATTYADISVLEGRLCAGRLRDEPSQRLEAVPIVSENMMSKQFC